jgi:hypothetical protein
MLVVAAAVLCLSGLAGAATTITFLNTYDHDGNTATPMVTKPAGTYLWFDPNNWFGGAPPQFEGESATISGWSGSGPKVLDLAGEVVDLVGRNYDPGKLYVQNTSGLSLIDSSPGKTSYIKVGQLETYQWPNVTSGVPIIVDDMNLWYRGGSWTQNASLDANTIRVGKCYLTVNAPTTVKTINMYFDNGIAWPYVPSVTFNGPVTGLTAITMAEQMWGEYDANGDGALGTGTVNVVTGSVVVRQAQTTFPTITLGANCTLAGNLAGATYGAGGKVQFQAGSILGDTVGTNNPTRADANGATLYKPVVAITSGTILSGDDGIGPYKGVGIGSWSDSNSIGAVIEARPGSGDLNIGIAARNFYFDANTTLKGDGTSTTANIKVFPGNGRIRMTSGGINQAAINASVPNLITTFNIDGVEGDKSPTLDRVAGSEGYTVLRTSGTAAILPGQTVKITNGVYQMDVEGNTETIQGRLIIGAGGALQLLDSNSSAPYVGAGEPIQSSATGHLEVQDRGLLVISGGDTLGAIGTDASRVTVSGTPMVSFHRADSGYWGANTWTAQITIDAAANPGLQKILDQSNIVLHSTYKPSSTSAGNSVFLGDGLRIREGGLVTTTWPLDSQAPQAFVGASTVYFGPANNGGSFTIATGPYVPINLYCPVGDAGRQAGTITVGSTDPIESFDNLTWYPYNVSLGRVVGIPTGAVTFAAMVYAENIVCKSGSLTISGGTSGTKEIIHNSTTGNLTISGVAANVRKIVVNSGNFTLSSGTTGTDQGITFNSTGTMTLSGPAIASPYVYVNAGTCNASGGNIDNLGMHIISHKIVNVSNDFGSGSVTAASDGYVNLNNGVTAVNNVTIDSSYVSGSRGVNVGGTTTVVGGRLSGAGSWGNQYLTMGAAGVVAPGGNSGNDVGSINNGGTGLWFQDGATIEWQMKDPGKDPGEGWDVIYGTTFDFAVTSETNAIVNFNILDAGLTKDIVATDKFAIAIIQGAGAIDIPTGAWTRDFTAPKGWDKTGASLYYDTGDNTLYLTGLVVRFTVPGDTNGDKVVDAADFITLKKNFGRTDALDAQNGNFTTGDTNVNWADLSTLMNNMGATGGAPATAPEPATLGLLAFGALAILRRRRGA